nr:twin transmembrane helix small protein [uncultured Cohaesibacter sp.]
MAAILQFAIPIALIIVALVLVFGLVNMMRGKNPNRSQTLMRWRIIVQFVAILLVMLALYVMQ